MGDKKVQEGKEDPEGILEDDEFDLRVVFTGAGVASYDGKDMLNTREGLRQMAALKKLYEDSSPIILDI